MKKLIFGLVLVFIGISCFADVKLRHDVFGKSTETIYWNTDYNAGPDNTNWAERWEKDRSKNGWTSEMIATFLIGSPKDDTYYRVMLLEDNRCWHFRIWFCQGDYKEKIIDDTPFYDYNYAKFEYNRWCDMYKKYVMTNWHHYK